LKIKLNYLLEIENLFNKIIKKPIIKWGLGIGDWGLGVLGVGP
jgi:hypothetical protein